MLLAQYEVERGDKTRIVVAGGLLPGQPKAELGLLRSGAAPQVPAELPADGEEPAPAPVPAPATGPATTPAPAKARTSSGAAATATPPSTAQADPAGEMR